MISQIALLYWPMKGVFVGTSGWIYKGWAGTFNPPHLVKTGELAYYATRFNTVEINATFYRLPLESMVKGWRERSPENFIFAVKGSHFITQMKKLNVDRASIKIFFDSAKLLKEKCGPILWQLPPNFRFNGERLDRFLKMAPKKYRHAVEFRHPSWYDHAETFEILRHHNAAHVPVSSTRMPMNLSVTSDFIYLRFHGLEHGAAHDYTCEELQPWAAHCRRCIDNGIDVFAYFNNDLNIRAPGNAEMFREMIIKLARKGRKSSPRHELATTDG
ncbi:MAG TPA: DUF72 domain-containing protein [Candidatus Acidoferrum sp.]|nr:DUF72 domain-containing protein [Candidatus Acidoferrum sp.]